MNITTYKIHEVFLEVNKFISKKKKYTSMQNSALL